MNREQIDTLIVCLAVEYQDWRLIQDAQPQVIVL